MDRRRRKGGKKPNPSKKEDHLTVGETIPISEDETTETDGEDSVDWKKEIKRH